MFKIWHPILRVDIHSGKISFFYIERTLLNFIQTGLSGRVINEETNLAIDKPTYRKHMLNKSEIVFCSTFLLQNKLHNHHYIGEVSTCLIKLSFWQWLDMDKPMETRREFFKVSTIGENPELIKCLVVRFYIQVFLS